MSTGNIALTCGAHLKQTIVEDHRGLLRDRRHLGKAGLNQFDLLWGQFSLLSRSVMRGLDPRIHLQRLMRFDGLPGQARQ